MTEFTFYETDYYKEEDECRFVWREYEKSEGKNSDGSQMEWPVSLERLGFEVDVQEGHFECGPEIINPIQFLEAIGWEYVAEGVFDPKEKV